MDVSVPANARATVVVPGCSGAAAVVTESGKSIWSGGKYVAGQADGTLEVSHGSGSYVFARGQ